MSANAGETHETGLRGALAALRRTLAPADHLALWTLTLDGAVAGSLMREGGRYRLELFGKAGTDDPEPAGLAGGTDDVAALEEALAERLGGIVRLHAVAA